MGKISKTAKASMGNGQVAAKKTISDEDYIKQLRYDVSNGIHATQEGAKALLRAYDAANRTIATLAESTTALLQRAEAAEEQLAKTAVLVPADVDAYVATSRLDVVTEGLAPAGQQEHTVIMDEIARA